ncbi:MAG: MFS transporter [Deltaproteobacteria bacterium]|nr:MFS transporter [Deltaproteobacteria bacterium]
MKRTVSFDWWLSGFCLSRSLTQAITMTYAAAIPVLQQEWGMTAARAGTVSSGFQLGYGVSLLVISILADRWGAKVLYLWSMIGTALFSLAFALFARDHISALALYTVVALSLGGNYTTGLMILALRYPVERRGRATGAFIASSSLGYVLSLALSGFTIPIGGYRLSFLAASLASVIGCVLSWIVLGRTELPADGRTQRPTLRGEVLSNRPALLLIGAYTCHCWELLGMWAWTPAFLSSYFVLKGVAGTGAAGLGSYAAAAFHMAGIFASFWMGGLSDRLGRGRVIMGAAGASALCSFVFGWSIGWPLVVVLLIGLVYAFSSIGDSPVLSVALTEVVSPSYLGRVFGLRSMLGFGAGAVSPVVFGAVLDWTNPSTAGAGPYAIWGWAFVTLGFPGVGAFWGAHLFRKSREAPPRIPNPVRQAGPAG